MAVDVLPTVIYSSMMGTTVFALFQIGGMQKQRQTFYLAGLQILLLIHILGELFIYSGAYQYAPSLAGAQFPMRMLLGPALFFYASATMSPDKTLSKTSVFLALLGPLLVIIGMIPFIFGISAEEKLALATPATRDPDLYQIALYTCVFAMLAFSAFTTVYLVAAYRLQQRHQRQLMARFSDIDKRSMAWFRYLLLLWGFTWFLFILDFGLNFFGLRWFGSDVVLPVVEALVLMTFSHFALRQSIIKDSEKGEAEEPKRQPSLPVDKMKTIADQLQNVMANDGLYLEEDLSLKRLSERTKVSENHISETLSQFLGTNFFSFVNRYRVEHAKEQLANSQKTVSEIAYASGFNAKSTFNTAFKKMTGLTPTAYRSEEARTV